MQKEILTKLDPRVVYDANTRQIDWLVEHGYLTAGFAERAKKRMQKEVEVGAETEMELELDGEKKEEKEVEIVWKLNDPEVYLLAQKLVSISRLKLQDVGIKITNEDEDELSLIVQKYRVRTGELSQETWKIAERGLSLKIDGIVNNKARAFLENKDPDARYLICLFANASRENGIVDLLGFPIVEELG